ncbi:transmembrane protein, putative (macronuclear) [Tetrahymena thermophila SB210]|uniref:Transmembrane protein, putative n=1 Tax=Tetrahymena thermophila (strain SB210) TaxID=312017 RepID=Q22UA1_TETTS|nr:transmembrane protein, putative [Tetrahymena thermophila SB210]EAR88786.2 transmembrane protein, putative [Tetrahymena thermophila SB210]|eukprot:XP_001009031.2 transmembrane protein, putative [Tetrahymena thermophila SB210]
MMRIQYFLNLVILLSICFVSVSTTTVSCNAHPAFNKAKQIITNAVQQDAKGKALNDQLQQKFQSAQPQVRNAQDLGVCSNYGGQSTCCDTEIVKLIDKAALLKIKPIQKQKSAFQKLISVYATQLNKICNPSFLVQASITADKIFSNTALLTLYSYKQFQANCKINFAKAISSYTRGAMCSICAGVDQISDYFNAQGQLKIHPDSINSFEKATNDAIVCYSNIFTPANIDVVVKELNSAYIKKNNSCGDDVAKSVKDIFTNHKVVNDDGNGGKQCKGLFVYGEQTACQNVLQGNPQLEQQTQRLLRSSEREDADQQVRLLQAVPDAIQDPNGIRIFIQSTTDSLIDENGDAIVGVFDEQKTNPSKSNAHLLTLETLIILATIFVL